MEKPSIRFSNKGSIASGVTSRPVKPVPPVVMMTSTPSSAIQAFDGGADLLDVVGDDLARRQPVTGPSTRSTSVAPDLSSASDGCPRSSAPRC